MAGDGSDGTEWRRPRRWRGAAGPAAGGGEAWIHIGEVLPEVFGVEEVEAGLLLLLANPTAAATTKGDDHSDYMGLLERRPEGSRRKKERLNREIGKNFHRNFWGFLGEKEEEIERIPFPQLIWKKEQRGGRIGGRRRRHCARAGELGLCPEVEVEEGAGRKTDFYVG
uniref:DUF834 domain-containing protein n=1 Tax=Oryza sativa subsp. japonica TaxID=39947 RepID=Q2QSW9_ORYSJ|nr:hypothetical protein LOC_Os12g22660 [Oryza sativa Japonica Group]